MDEKRREKTIDFLLQQQAQFYADLEGLKEVQKAAEKRTNVLERACLNLYNTSVEQGKNIGELYDAQVEQSKNIAIVTSDIAELRAAQKETNDRLNAVIFMAEKYFSGENGKKKR